MKFKNLIFLTGMLLPVTPSFAQYAEDALRFSQTEQGATARFKALGGAQTALGGDASSLASNPAGLGLFTRSELSFTPDISNSIIKSNYLNSSSSIQKDRAGINQFGAVFYNPTRKYNSSDASSGWLSFNFGIAYNKTNNFNSTTEYGGLNPRSSFGDYMSDLASNPDDLLATAGYDSHLIELDQTSGTYFPITNINNNQMNTVFRSGNQSEVNFSLGGNYNNNFYLGASLGIASINFNADREFIESGLTLNQVAIDQQGLTVYNETKPYLDAEFRLSYQSNQETRGTGVNAKLGFIYRPSPNVRFGMSFISPTWYTIAESFSEKLDTHFNKSNGQTETFKSDEEIYDSDYRLRTPYRFNGGVAVIVKNLGLLTGDIEYVDYASIHFSSEEREASNNTNRDIRNLYKGAVNLKVGAEIKLNPLMLRAGYSTNGNPYQNGSFTTNTISTGIGYRLNNLSFDLTYSNLSSNYTTSPYLLSQDYRFYSSTGSGESAEIQGRRRNIFATIGLRF